jgi:quercetin dioxygenase-like cupin family protein
MSTEPRKPYRVKKVEPIAVGTDVQARMFTLAPDDAIPWHQHSECMDHYFVLRGALTIETRNPDRRRVLEIGDRHQIRPGTAHLISNRGAEDCEFLLVQGVGKYDWIKAEG